MKARRAIVVTASCIVPSGALIGWLMPPSAWQKIERGMSQSEVTAIVPVFDIPSGAIKADYKYEKRGFFMWELAVIWNPSGVDATERTLYCNWPEKKEILKLRK